MLESFVFFHLGSDARIGIEERAAAVRVELAHQRIRPLEFELAESRLEAILAEPVLFEEMMLDFLVAHRRS